MHALLLLPLKGTPFIYYGDEIGMENTFIPKRKIQDLYGKIFWPFYKGRDQARTPMQWNNNKYAGFSLKEPWLPANKNYSHINVDSQAKKPDSIYSIYKALIALRKEYPVLQSGKIEFLNKGKQNILAYTHSLGNKK